ncbi:UNVERIFIED_CONTAM: hypothetical protein Scaly_3093800 [Sesamum calycinum]|uniref:Uncharacterized protein n=1 Tax=Sesamum calycinum TaxID=2727403 RepID=A0AAW2JPR9_9LAMI
MDLTDFDAEKEIELHVAEIVGKMFVRRRGKSLTRVKIKDVFRLLQNLKQFGVVTHVIRYAESEEEDNPCALFMGIQFNTEEGEQGSPSPERPSPIASRTRCRKKGKKAPEVLRETFPLNQFVVSSRIEAGLTHLPPFTSDVDSLSSERKSIADHHFLTRLSLANRLRPISGIFIYSGKRSKFSKESSSMSPRAVITPLPVGRLSPDHHHLTRLAMADMPSDHKPPTELHGDGLFDSQLGRVRFQPGRVNPELGSSQPKQAEKQNSTPTPLEKSFAELFPTQQQTGTSIINQLTSENTFWLITTPSLGVKSFIQGRPTLSFADAETEELAASYRFSLDSGTVPSCRGILLVAFDSPRRGERFPSTNFKIRAILRLGSHKVAVPLSPTIRRRGNERRSRTTTIRFPSSLRVDRDPTHQFSSSLGRHPIVQNFRCRWVAPPFLPSPGGRSLPDNHLCVGLCGEHNHSVGIGQRRLTGNGPFLPQPGRLPFSTRSTHPSHCPSQLRPKCSRLLNLFQKLWVLIYQTKVTFANSSLLIPNQMKLEFAATSMADRRSPSPTRKHKHWRLTFALRSLGNSRTVFPLTANSTDCSQNSASRVRLHFPELPAHLFRKDALFAIANNIGTPLQIADSTFNQSNLANARVCVEIDLLKPLLKEIDIQICGLTIVQSIVYEHIPSYCSLCKHVGHRDADCYSKGNHSPKTDCKYFLANAKPASIGAMHNINGRPTLIFSDEETQSLAAKFRFALVGKFSHGSPPYSQLHRLLVNSGL